MSDQRNGGIAWTEQTWNPLRGCTRVSEGCRNCYAESMAARFCGTGMPYEGTINPETKRWSGTIKLVPEHLTDPLRWTRPRMIFVNSMSDLFHEDVPFQFVADVFAVMACTTRHTYQVLTKRPARMLEFFAWLNEELDSFGHPTRVDSLHVWPQWVPAKGKRAGYDNCGPLWPLENVWLGVTAENQETADERIPLLLKVPAAVHWVSMEPLLGPVKFRPYTLLTPHCFVCEAEDSLGQERGTQSHPINCVQRTKFKDVTISGNGVAWVVAGGESGPNARPMHPDWARSLRDQCADAGVPFLFKQWGAWAPGSDYYSEDDAARDASLDRPYRLITASGTQWVEEFDGQPPIGSWSMHRVGKKCAGRLLDGVQHDGYPGVKL